MWLTELTPSVIKRQAFPWTIVESENGSYKMLYDKAGKRISFFLCLYKKDVAVFEEKLRQIVKDNGGKIVRVSAKKYLVGRERLRRRYWDLVVAGNEIVGEKRKARERGDMRSLGRLRKVQGAMLDEMARLPKFSIPELLGAKVL